MSRRLAKKLKKARRFLKAVNIFGPVHLKPSLKTDSKDGLPFRVGTNYKLTLPSSVHSTSWAPNWDGKIVELIGYYNLFSRGTQVVCLKQGDKFLAASADWITPIKIEVQTRNCCCELSVIWASGCQCGGL